MDEHINLLLHRKRIKERKWLEDSIATEEMKLSKISVKYAD